MNCREFTEKFEVGADLNESAKSHLEICEGCRIFQNEETQLTQIFKSLPKVDAPKDFEFGFKSKLAASQNDKSLSPFWKMPRFILPLATMALIVGFVVYNFNMFDRSNTVQITEKPTIEQETEQTKDVGIQPSNNLVARTQTNNNQSNVKTVVAENVNQSVGNFNAGQKTDVTKSEDKPEIEPKPKKKEEILSSDITVQQPKVIKPEGINPERKIVNNANTTDEVKFTAEEILLQLGIETANENGNLRVKNVRKNSAGENSGVKNGDVVTAIDGQKLSDETVKTRSVQGKTLTVKRNEQEINIQIKNN